MNSSAGWCLPLTGEPPAEGTGDDERYDEVGGLGEGARDEEPLPLWSSRARLARWLDESPA